MRNQIYSLGLCCILGLGLTTNSLAQEESEEIYAESSFEAEESHFLGFLKAHDPARLEKLEQIRLQEPELYSEIVNTGVEELRYLKHLETTHPKLHQRKMREIALRSQLDPKVERYNQTGDTTLKASLKAEMYGILDQLFEVQIQDGMTDILRMEHELEEAKKTLAARRENKNIIVHKKLSEMLNEGDFEW